MAGDGGRRYLDFVGQLVEGLTAVDIPTQTVLLVHTETVVVGPEGAGTIDRVILGVTVLKTDFI